MNAKYIFRLQSEDNRRPLPSKLLIGQDETETASHVLLKLLAYLLFYRERLQREVNLHIDSIPFVPDLVQLDYSMRPALWVECGDCGVAKLNKLAVKIPDAELWVVKQSIEETEILMRAMEKAELRRNRYHIVSFDAELFQELCGLLLHRNEIRWYRGTFEPGLMQFDFNSLWFEMPLRIDLF